MTGQFDSLSTVHSGLASWPRNMQNLSICKNQISQIVSSYSWINYLPTPFENSPFQTCLSLLSFYSIWSFVDELCIGLGVCPTPVLGAPLTELNSFQGYWCYRSFVIIIRIKQLNGKLICGFNFFVANSKFINSNLIFLNK